MHAELEQAQHLFVTGFEKLKVQQDFELRKAVRAAGGKYRVIKNNLAEKAAAGTRAGSLFQGLAGMTSVAYTSSDPVALAKALTAYAKANPTVTFKAGLVEGRIIEAKAVQELAGLPSREQTLAKLLFLIRAPAGRVATVVNMAGRNLAVALNQACKEGKFSS